MKAIARLRTLTTRCHPSFAISRPSMRTSTTNNPRYDTHGNTCSNLKGMCSRTSASPFKILGIETSCDETGVAIVNSSGEILGHSVASQFAAHEPYGGIVPPIAAREHEKNIEPVMKEVLQHCGIEDLSNAGITAIAVTVGPGMYQCLKVGVATAKSLCRKHNLPLIRVNHLEAHALMVRMEYRRQLCNSLRENELGTRIDFPFLVLLASGGHSQILLSEGTGKYTQLGGTLDDSLGEAYDKVARSMGIPLELGGKGLEDLATRGNELAYKLPRPLALYPRNCDLSFAGLKSATARLIEQAKLEVKKSNGMDPSDTDVEVELPPQTLADIAASFQFHALKHVADRLDTALKWCEDNLDKPINTMVVSGGVARNKQLRSRISEVAHAHKVDTLFPPMELCTDNGAMVAWAGVEIYENLTEEMKDPHRVSQNHEEDVFLTDINEIEKVNAISRWPLAHNLHNLFNIEYPDFVQLRRRGAV